MNRQLTDIETLTADEVEHEIFIRYGTSYRRETLAVKKRVLKFKAVQILRGDPEGFPLQVFEDSQLVAEQRSVQDAFDLLCITLCKVRAEKGTIAPFFTVLVFLFARVYHLTLGNADPTMKALLRGVEEALQTHYGQTITIREEVDSDTSSDAVVPSKAVKSLVDKQVQVLDDKIQVQVLNLEAALRRPRFKCKEVGHLKENCPNKRVRNKRVRSAEGGLPRKGRHL